MDSWRQSFVFCREQEYGQGHDPVDMLGYWYQPPPGARFSSTYTRDGKKLRPVSARTWKEMNYGKVSGSWQMQFPLDYDFMEIFMFVYDTYEFEPAVNGTYGKTLGRHSFRRTDDGVTPSFCVRRKTLYRPVGADGDLIDELYGCLVTACKIEVNGGDSRVMVHLSGVFADQALGVAGSVTGLLDGTDYRLRDKNPIQYSCMHIGDEPVSDVMNLSVQMKNSVSLKHGVLVPVARTYSEDESSNTFSCVVFAKDSALFRQRVFTGGYGYGYDTHGEMSAPLPLVKLISGIDKGAHRGCSLTVSVTDVVIRSMGWGSDGSVMTDRLDTVDCTSISLVVENDVLHRYDLYQDIRGDLNLDLSDLSQPENYVMITQYETPQNKVVVNEPDHLMLSSTYTS